MEWTAYIGTYTEKDSRGIYRIGFDRGRTCLYEEVRATNPSYLIKNDSTLYAVCEKTRGTVASYHIQSDKSLVLTGKQEVGGDAPCHLCIDGQFLYVSNYASGSLAEFTLDDRRAINRPPRVLVRTDKSTHPELEGKSHVHFSCVTPGGAYLAVCDLGLDEILFYRRTCSGISDPVETVSVPSGCGPRHAAFGGGEIWYVLCELTCELLVYRGYGKKAELLQHLPALPKKDTKGFCAALRLSSDGRLLLASVRGADTVLLFDVMKGGLVDAPRYYDSRGKWPRDAVFTPCGKYVMCACELDNCLTVFSLAGGRLKYLDSFAIPSPTCICFA